MTRYNMVYLIYEYSYNGEASWQSVVDVFADEVIAKLRAIELNNSKGYNRNNSKLSYKVKPMEVR